MLLIPGSSPEHPEQRWPAERFAKIATWVADAGITPVIIGAKAEGEIGAKIMKLEPRTKSLIGRTDLFQLATLSERAVFAIGGDTGPMHLRRRGTHAWRLPVCAGVERPDGGRPAQCLEPQDPPWPRRPQGGPMMVLHAAALEAISVDDVKRAAIGLGVLPCNIAPPEPVKLPGEADAATENPPTESSPELAEGSDS